MAESESVKRNFDERISELIMSKGTNNSFLTQIKYEETIHNVSQLKSGLRKKGPNDYALLKRFDVVRVSNVAKLIYPVSEGHATIKYYVTNDELFDIIHAAHIRIGHGGRNRMIKETQLKYKNVTTECIMIYLNLCTSCLKKSKVAKKGLVVKPMLFKEMNSRAQVDMIDMQSQPDGDYKWILVYQDHFTKFVQIRPTKSKRATEVAYNLLDTFCTFGAPSVLQSDNGREFSNSVIEELKDMWDGLKIVHGKPRHSQSQGSVERANRDIEDMMSTWMDSNSTDKWADGLRFVQCMKNRAMFGQPMKVGLKTSNPPDEAVESLQTEEDLDILINSITSVEKEGEEIQQEGTREDEVSIDEVELERREEGESERREEEDIARRGEVELERSDGVKIERREEVELEIREEVEFEVEEREGMEEEQGEAPPRAQNENVLEMVAGDIGNEDPDDKLSLSPTL